MRPTNKSPRKNFIKWTSLLFGVCLIATCNYLSNNVDAFKCDLVNGSDHLPGWSNSKKEAIKRGTYVCDVIMTHKSNTFDKKYYLKPLKGWVENSWRRGFWYLTTNKDTGSDVSYRIMIDDSGDKRHWLARNDSGLKNGDEFLNYNTTYPPDQFEAYLNALPPSDTLYYNVLKQDTLDFKPENIEGVFRIVLFRH
jgi:hypothetical protein